MPQTATQSLVLTVVPGSNPLTIMTTSLPDAKIGVQYSFQLVATGGTAPYKWAMSSGQLPAGISLATDGVLSGIATTAGPATFAVVVTDASA